MKQLEQIFRSTTQGFYTSLRSHMPSSALRHFNLWALSTENPLQESWLQIVGIPQFAKLTYSLLSESVGSDKWDELVRYTVIMNSYLIYETVSDNLAFGLAHQQPGDSTFELRREVLIDFNRAMIARLQGRLAESEIILQIIKPSVKKLSGFEYSLTGVEQREMVNLFLEANPEMGYGVEDIEFGLWNALVANIEACADVVDATKDFQLSGILRNGLIRRYAAVNDLLYENVINRDTLLTVSTDTILVIPVLTYYIAVLAEALEPNPMLIQVLQNGVLCQALEDAALMVRLLNDIGTNLVATDEFHRGMLDDLYAEVSLSVSKPTPTFSHILNRYSETAEFMTRIRKDLTYSEFNVSLHNLMAAPCTPISLLLFADNLLYFKQQYKLRQSRLKDNLKIIARTMGNEVNSGLIHKFVYFHERIYRYQFDQQAGDYATKPNVATFTN